MLKLLLFFLFFIKTFADTGADIGNIMALKGKAHVQRGISRLLSAKAGMSLFQGDKIITKARTRVQVILKDNTIITIGSNSNFEFDTFIYDGTKKSKLKVKARRGFFRSVTGKIGKLAPERFTVETSSATIGIRGTDFSVNISTDAEIYKCYQGAIRVFISDTFQDLIAGEAFEFRLDKTPVKQQMKEKKSRVVPKIIERVITKETIPNVAKEIIEELNDIRSISDLQDIKDKLIVPIIPEGEKCVHP